MKRNLPSFASMAHGKKIKKLIINKMTFILLIPKLFLRVSFRDVTTERTMMEMFFYYLITSASQNMGIHNS